MKYVASVPYTVTDDKGSLCNDFFWILKLFKIVSWSRVTILKLLIVFVGGEIPHIPFYHILRT